MEEIKWFTIPRFPTYEINERLDVRHKEFGKTKSPFLSDGYWRHNIEYLSKRHKPYLHQLVAWVFVPNPENKPEVHHIDCNPLNNHWSNLQWVTKQEHKELSKQNGQIAHKLKPEDVIYVRDNYSPEKENELAFKFNVLPSTIYNIAIGASRKDVVGGKIHESKGITKKIVNIKTGEIFRSAEELSSVMGIKIKEIRRQLSGERYNTTDFRYLGQEHLSKFKPKKPHRIVFIPHSFGVVISHKRRLKSANPRFLWKKVVQCDKNGNEVGRYESIREAARSVGASDHKAIQKLLNGRRGKSYKGFIWKYAD